MDDVLKELFLIFHNDSLVLNTHNTHILFRRLSGVSRGLPLANPWSQAEFTSAQQVKFYGVPKKAAGLPAASDCQKNYLAENFGGKESVKD